MEIPNLPTSRGSGVVCEKFAIFDIIEVLKNQLLVLLMFILRLSIANKFTIKYRRLFSELIIVFIVICY